MLFLIDDFRWTSESRQVDKLRSHIIDGIKMETVFKQKELRCGSRSEVFNEFTGLDKTCKECAVRNSLVNFVCIKSN